MGEHIFFAIRTTDLPEAEIVYTIEFVFARLGNIFPL